MKKEQLKMEFGLKLFQKIIAELIIAGSAVIYSKKKSVFNQI